MNVLFVCGKARKRSPTAAHLVASWKACDTDCGGLSKDADEVLSLDQIAWADVIIVMERRHKTRLTAQFGKHLRDTPVKVADIPDRYDYMEPALITLIETRIPPLLGI